MEGGSELTLAEALGSLREQLLDALDRAQGAELALICKSVEVELALTLTTTYRGEGKAGLWSVITVGGGVDHSSGSTHRVKLSLMPQLRDKPGELPMELSD